MRQGLVEIDGANGEGGGQILRTALALAMITRRPTRVKNIRVKRSRPGLLPQHLACVEAAAHVSGASVDGAKLGSTMVELVANEMRGGERSISIGTAGSASLVLQTVLVPLLTASAPSRIIIEGGTHNPSSPPFEFLARAYVPALERMGARVTVTLERYGFYPAGGGRIVAEITPGSLVGVGLDDAAPVRARRARAIVARLPRSIAERELAVVRRELGWRDDECTIDEVASAGPGNALVLEVERDGVREVVTGFGEKHVTAEQVASGAVRALGRYLAGNVPVGEHLADQLMLPMAIAHGGRFRSLPLSSHATTNLETIRKFLDVPVTVRSAAGSAIVNFGS